MNEFGDTDEHAQNLEKQKMVSVSEIQMRGVQHITSDTFHREYIDSIELKNTEFDGYPAAVKLAKLQKQYVESLLDISGGIDCPNFSSIEDLQVWDQAIQEMMFDESQPDSLAGKDILVHKNSEVKQQFSGATSVLTLMDLWQDIYPEGAQVSLQVADEETDVKGKIDVVIETDKTITLLQLKTNKFDDANVIPVNEIKSYLSGKIPEKHVVRMIQEQRKFQAQEREKQQNDSRYTPKEVKLAIVEVPGIESNCVGNVFGKITDDEKRSQLVDKMRTQAQKARIVPLTQAA
jgi:hypothetical protein